MNGFAGDVALSLSGLPSAVGSASFTPAVIGGAGTSNLAIAVSATAPPGSYPLTVTGSSGPIVHSAPLTLVVSPAPDYALSISPSSRTVSRGGSTTYTVSVSSTGGFAGTVSLSVSGLPLGATASFVPSSVVAPGTSTLKIKATGWTVRGTFTLTVTGRNGSTSHQAAASLTVR